MTEPITNGLKMEELFDEITNVIKNHFTKNMSEFMKRYELLEQTHQQLMKLPSIAYELQRHNVNTQDNTNTQEDDNIDEFVFKLSTKLGEICGNQLSEIAPVLSKILDYVDKKNLEEPKKAEEVVKASITTACENENIKIIIKEEPESKVSEEVYTQPAILSDDEEESDEEEEESDEEESDEEEEEEEDEDKEEEEEEDVEEEEETELAPNVEEIEEDEVETEAEEEEEEDEEDEEEEPNLAQKVEEEEVDEVEEEPNLAQPFQKVEEEEEEELFEIEIDDVTYCTNNDEAGFIYELSEDGDVGEKVGYFKDSEPFFYADE
jgi:hypothetical protein